MIFEPIGYKENVDVIKLDSEIDIGKHPILNLLNNAINDLYNISKERCIKVLIQMIKEDICYSHLRKNLHNWSDQDFEDFYHEILRDSPGVYTFYLTSHHCFEASRFVRENIREVDPTLKVSVVRNRLISPIELSGQRVLFPTEDDSKLRYFDNHFAVLIYDPRNGMYYLASPANYIPEFSRKAPVFQGNKFDRLNDVLVSKDPYALSLGMREVEWGYWNPEEFMLAESTETNIQRPLNIRGKEERSNVHSVEA